MALRLFGNARAFAGALAASGGAVYSICNRDRLDPHEVLSIERRAADRKHRDLAGETRLRERAQADVEAYFREAARRDREWRFAYSSKVVLSVPEYQDLQKVFLLRLHLAAEPQVDALLLVPDARLRRLFRELFQNAWPAPRLPLPAAHAWGRFARTLARTLLHRPHGPKPRVLVFTLSSGAPKPGTDAYFGNLAVALGTRAPTLTVYLASGPAVKLPRDTLTAPLEAYVSPASVVAEWLAALFSAPGAASAHDFKGDPLAPLHAYMRRAEVRSGEYFMQRLLARAFGALLERVKPEVLVYPFENRSWEKHLNAQAKLHGVGRRIGYQHSSITPRHLAFHLEAGEVGDDHLPGRIVTIGSRTAALVRASAPVLSDRLVAGASLRTARQAVAPARTPAVLVAISSSRSEAAALLRATHSAASHLSDVPFIVRTHPTIPIDDLAALFDWTSNVELSAGRSLTEDLSRAAMVAYSSSTVALEGMLYGRLPIFIDIGDTPSGDPIAGADEFKLTATGGSEFARAVEKLRALEPARREAMQDAARAYAESYLRAPTPDAVRDMADAMLHA